MICRLFLCCKDSWGEREREKVSVKQAAIWANHSWHVPVRGHGMKQRHTGLRWGLHRYSNILLTLTGWPWEYPSSVSQYTHTRMCTNEHTVCGGVCGGGSRQTVYDSIHNSKWLFDWQAWANSVQLAGVSVITSLSLSIQIKCFIGMENTC